MTTLLPCPFCGEKIVFFSTPSESGMSFTEELYLSQQRLDEEAEMVLYENRWDMYEE